MMDARELRIGNLVSYLGKETIISCIQHTSEIDYVATPKSGAVTKNQIDPVPITEELLLMAGFEYKNDFVLTKNSFTICFEKKGSELGCYLECIGIDVLFIHHLQNIIHALSGVELEFKELKE